MRGSRSVLVLLALCLACGDGIIGRDDCRSEQACGLLDTGAPTLLDVDYRVVDQLPMAEELVPEAEWQPPPCNAEGCEAAPKLVRASGDAVWMSAHAPLLMHWVQWADSHWTNIPFTLAPSPGTRATQPAFISSAARGRALLHLDWPSADSVQSQTAWLSELVLVEQADTEAGPGTLERVPLQRDPQLAGVIEGSNGYLFFDAKAYGGGALLLVGHDGLATWRRTKANFPKGVNMVGAAAVALGGGFVVGAHTGDKDPSFGLMSLDRDGEIESYALPPSSSWKSLSMLALGGDAYALAARTDINGAVSASGDNGENEGHLEIVRFEGAEGAERPSGVRILRNCFHALNVNGFTSDPSGNLYVSTVAGEGRGEPQGVLCKISRSWDLSCRQTKPGVSLGDIAATGVGTLFVVLDGRLARVSIR